ncbi:MAG: hypothetical protein JWN04_6682 [Myxococcaceae bacterium]|nr:hypothetical protein [Myxococcaceae bacterium]
MKRGTHGVRYSAGSPGENPARLALRGFEEPHLEQSYVVERQALRPRAQSSCSHRSRRLEELRQAFPQCVVGLQQDRLAPICQLGVSFGLVC